MRSALTIGTVVVLSAAALGGCNSERRDRVSPDQDPVTAGDPYVAIGDSYTALGGDQDHLVALDGCNQSDLNYPHQVAERLDLNLTDASCGGARTSALFGSQTTLAGFTLPPQAEAIDEDTALVTLRIGSNDHAMFAHIVNTCTVLSTRDPDGSPCADADDRAAVSYADKIRSAQDNLVEGIEKIVRRAPDARVIVVGYPQIVPAAGTCPELPLARGDYEFARRYNVMIADAFEAAAHETGAEYLDVFAATEGHDICSDDPWIAGSKAERPAVGPYHPYQEEHDLVADMLVERLTGD